MSSQAYIAHCCAKYKYKFVSGLDLAKSRGSLYGNNSNSANRLKLSFDTLPPIIPEYRATYHIGQSLHRIHQ